MKQTSVEWLVEHLTEYGFDLSHHELEIKQAKEMEKAKKEKFDNMLSMLEEAYRRLENTNMVSLRKEIKETINETFKSE